MASVRDCFEFCDPAAFDGELVGDKVAAGLLAVMLFATKSLIPTDGGQNDGSMGFAYNSSFVDNLNEQKVNSSKF